MFFCLNDCVLCCIYFNFLYALPTGVIINNSSRLNLTTWSEWSGGWLRHEMVYLLALKSWRKGQLDLAHGTKMKIKKTKSKNRVAQEKRSVKETGARREIESWFQRQREAQRKELWLTALIDPVEQVDRGLRLRLHELFFSPSIFSLGVTNEIQQHGFESCRPPPCV